MSECAYWCPRVPNGVCGSLLVSVGVYSRLRVPTGAY